MTEEYNTVEDVSRDADKEDDGVEVADEDVVYGGEHLIGDDVVGVVPRNKDIHVTAAVAFTVVILNLSYFSHCNLLNIKYITASDILLAPFFPRKGGE